MSIGERIKYLRKNELNLTQNEFGDKIGASGSTIVGWEKGNRMPNDITLKLICKEFNVNYAWLIDGVGDVFNTIGETLLDRLCAEYELNEVQRKIVEAVIQLDDDEINAFTMRFFGFKAICH